MRPAFSSSNIDNCPARHTAEFLNLFQRHFPQGGPNPPFPLFALRIWVHCVDVWFRVNQSRFDVLKAIGFFFFQAEDGIRDGRVTGVQTCALPILRSSWRSRASRTRVSWSS